MSRVLVVVKFWFLLGRVAKVREGLCKPSLNSVLAKAINILWTGAYTPSAYSHIKFHLLARIGLKACLELVSAFFSFNCKVVF